MLLQGCFRRELRVSTLLTLLEAALTGGSDGDKFCLEDVTNLKVARRNIKGRYYVTGSY
jgi:hypothetical protein